MADQPSTITYTNPNTGFSVTANIPAEIVAMLQWMRDNVYLPQYPAPAPAGATDASQPPEKKYLHEAHVIYRDVLEVLVPSWARTYQEGLVAELQAQIDATRQQISKSVEAGVAALTVS